jgi:hypothetical protein
VGVRNCILVLAAAATVAFGYLRSYEVTPTQAAWSGLTHVAGPNNWVGNTFTCNFDSAVKVQIFLGDTGRSHAAVAIEVREYPNGAVPIAYNGGVAQSESHDWLRLPLTTVSGRKFVRGKTYIAKVTRPNDSINYYFCQAANGGPYKYGQMIVGGQGIAA